MLTDTSATQSPSSFPVNRTALIADDHSLLLVGLSILLKEEFGFGNVIEADSFQAAQERLAEHPGTEVAFFDLYMPGMSGPNSLASIRSSHPDLKLVMLSASENSADEVEAIKAGANGYIPKSYSEVKLISAIRAILLGQQFEPALMSHKGAACDRKSFGRRHRSGGDVANIVLTKRQREIVDCVRKGLTNRQIAQQLDLTENTVSNHLSNLFLIFNVRNRTELALLF